MEQKKLFKFGPHTLPKIVSSSLHENKTQRKHKPILTKGKLQHNLQKYLRFYVICVVGFHKLFPIF